MDLSDDTPDIEQCIDNNELLQSGFAGGLQANLTKLMISYNQGDLNSTKDVIIGLNEFMESVFN